MDAMNSLMQKFLEKENISAATLLQHLENLHQEYFDFYPPDVKTIHEVPTAFQFLRHYLSQNRPVIIKNAIAHYPALKKWTNGYLRSRLQNEITVAVTPNGYADAVNDDYFVMPEERCMSFDEFLKTLENPESSVFYIQSQDNNFQKEFIPLLPDIDQHIPWTTEAIGRQPDAINFWMGDERAVTSLHKDHYENIYCVLRGKKEFILHAPVDAPWIPYENYDAGVYYEVGTGSDKIRPLNSKVNWIPVQPWGYNNKKYPLYERAQRIYATVEAGDAFYLPSLWFHHVRQSHGCIAVNYWYDMDFNSNYCHFKFLESVRNVIQETLGKYEESFFKETVK